MIKIVNKLIKYLQKPEKIMIALGTRGFLHFINDKSYIEYLFKAKTGKKLDLNKPETFNEKLQWLKLYDRNFKYTKLVDKFRVREYIKDTLGEKYLIPLIGVWDDFNEIDFNQLPNQFVLKTTHDSGGIVICRDKKNFNINQAKDRINKSLNSNYYYKSREWPYKNVKPRIIAEELIVDEYGDSLKDYKIMCFNGEPKIIQVMSDRDYDGFNINHYDVNWKELNINRNRYNKNPKGIQKPIKLNEMLEISRALSKNIPFLRVDLYYVNEKIYFGELTFYPASGYMDFSNISDDYLLGSWIDLPN